MIRMIETLTREHIKAKMFFDKKEDIKMFKSVCEELLKETCKWDLSFAIDCSAKTQKDATICVWRTDCGVSQYFKKHEKFKYCPYCGKPIEEATDE